MDGVRLEFGNDKSRLVRGVAIILMVTGHTLPGKVISFAVPLFSFLVGYGYAFARERNLRHGVRRVRHLLTEYWIILFGICLPIALSLYPKPITVPQILLGMFGLDPRLSFFCWYVYFYIFAMAVMPSVSRIVDRYGLKGALAVMALSGGLMLGAQALEAHHSHSVWQIADRCFHWLPVVVGGYWLARYNVFSRIMVPQRWWVPVVALAGMVAIYLLRAWPYAKIIDFVWAPLFSVLLAVVLAPQWLRPIRQILTKAGLQSGNIWFLHALFMTHSTKMVFGPLVEWITVPALKVVGILLLSYAMGVIITQLTGLVRTCFVRFVEQMRLRRAGR